MTDAPLIRLIRAEMQRFTGREYQIAFDEFDARSLQELLRFLLDAEYEHYGFVTQDLEQALPASPHETIDRSEGKHILARISRRVPPRKTDGRSLVRKAS